MRQIKKWTVLILVGLFIEIIIYHAAYDFFNIKQYNNSMISSDVVDCGDRMIYHNAALIDIKDIASWMKTRQKYYILDKQLSTLGGYSTYRIVCEYKVYDADGNIFNAYGPSSLQVYSYVKAKLIESDDGYILYWCKNSGKNEEAYKSELSKANELKDSTNIKDINEYNSMMFKLSSDWNKENYRVYKIRWAWEELEAGKYGYLAVEMKPSIMPLITPTVIGHKEDTQAAVWEFGREVELIGCDNMQIDNTYLIDTYKNDKGEIIVANTLQINEN